MPGRDDSVIVADALSQVVVGSGLVAAVERLGLLVFTYPEDDHVFSFRIFRRRQSTVVASSYRRHDPTRPDPTRRNATLSCRRIGGVNWALLCGNLLSAQ